MHNGKQESFNQTKGSAPHDDKSATRAASGSPSKHNMKPSTGKKDNKCFADSTPGV